ncbi:MAG: chorismate synthase [Bacteroidetes bacterium]|nr:chorismate synthase [Bacteroidota bacterium]
MAGNTFGKLFSLTSFGESHGAAIGGVIDGCPSNFELDFNQIQMELNRRRPGQSVYTTQRNEADEVEFLSGIFNGKTTGAPIAFIIKNIDQHSADYDQLSTAFRPSHADFTYHAKYGNYDYRGGGRASARETIARVVAGSIAKQILSKENIYFQAYVQQIGRVKAEKHSNYTTEKIESSPVRCPDEDASKKMMLLIEEITEKGDTLGGIIYCSIKGCPAGLGEPVFGKLQAELAKAMLSINAAKAFEYGSGFAGVELLGSEHNDILNPDFSTKTNHSGGIQGGISNGEEIYFRVAFKPIASLMQNQQTVNKEGHSVTLEGKGRHDVCVVPRAVPIVEAMAALVIIDFWLRWKMYSKK